MDRFHRSLALLRKPFQPGEAGFDRVFLLGEVRVDDAGRVVVAVDEQTPTVVYDAETRDALGLYPETPLISDMRKAFASSPYWLISCGTMWWEDRSVQEPRLILSRRDSRSSAPGDWVDACGRCDRPLTESVVNEGLEELLILHRGAFDDLYSPVVLPDRLRPLQGARYMGRDPLELKRRQIEAKREILNTKGLKPSAIDASTGIVGAWGTDDGLQRTVSLSAPDVDASPFEAFCFFDRSSNTLEVRRKAIVRTDTGDSLVVVDGEGFNRQTHSFTICELAHGFETNRIAARPTVRAYVEARQTGRRPDFTPKPI